MTFNSGNPPRPRTPEAKLADRSWRYGNSWWIFVPILSCGFLGWLGFLVAAIRTGKRHYWIATGVYAALFAAFFTLVAIDDGKDTVFSDIALVPFLGVWLAPALHASFMNRDYLRTIAHKGNWYQAPAVPQNRPQPDTTSYLGVSQADYYGPAPQRQPWSSAATPPPAPRQSGSTHWQQPTAPAPQPRPREAEAASRQANAPGSPVPINTADADTIAGHLGIDHVLANHIVNIRGRRGSYHDFDDLVAATGMQPHQLVRIRGRITFSGPDYKRPPNNGSGGRVLDY